MSIDTASLRLWRLISPALPIGSWSWSQALEYAVHKGWVHDRESTLQWLRGVLFNGLAYTDVPLLFRLQQAWGDGSPRQLEYWNAFALACRESRELLQEDQQLGNALARVLVNLDIEAATPWFGREDTSYLTMFALAGHHWLIPPRQLALGWLWAWCENQVTAAIKLVPLGQTDGQRILDELIGDLPGIVETGQATADPDVGTGLPGLAMASACHESQYTRLFRS